MKIAIETYTFVVFGYFIIVMGGCWERIEQCWVFTASAWTFIQGRLKKRWNVLFELGKIRNILALYSDESRRWKLNMNEKNQVTIATLSRDASKQLHVS